MKPLSFPEVTDSESVTSRKSLRACFSSFVAATAGDSLGFYAELETTTNERNGHEPLFHLTLLTLLNQPGLTRLVQEG